jgi:hypothetical protein
MIINLEAYKKLSDNSKMDYLLKNGHRLVNIYSDEHKAYWRPNSKGYSIDIKGAGKYTFEDALANTMHCGPEKKIKFRFVSEEPDLPSVKVWEGEEVFDDVHLKFDKYRGVHRGDFHPAGR